MFTHIWFRLSDCAQVLNLEPRLLLPLGGCTQVPHEGVMELLLGGALRACATGEALQLRRLDSTRAESPHARYLLAAIAVVLAPADVASSQLTPLHFGGLDKRAYLRVACGQVFVWGSNVLQCSDWTDVHGQPFAYIHGIPSKDTLWQAPLRAKRKEWSVL
jgi:hypothetical protein